MSSVMYKRVKRYTYLFHNDPTKAMGNKNEGPSKVGLTRQGEQKVLGMRVDAVLICRRCHVVGDLGVVPVHKHAGMRAKCRK